MSGDPAALMIEPLVGWPRRAQAGQSYLVTVDLNGPAAPEDWPYEEEEFDFGVSLDGSRRFVCEALNEPSVVLHRFGGTYGPARFVIKASRAPGPGTIWLTISNRWGVPVRTVELPSEIVADAVVGQGHVVVPALNGATATLPAEHTVTGQRVGRRPVSGVWSPHHITISYAGADRAWAVWTARQLERHGCQTFLLRWDPPPGVPLARLLADLLAAPGRVLLLLDEEYLRLGQRTELEWGEALGSVVTADPDRFAAVDLSARTLPAATAVLGPVSLRELDPAEALRRLLATLDLQDARPEPEDESVAPRFPDAPPAVWNVPRRNFRFTGRDTVLEELRALFENGPPTGARVALRGISGVGKSQIAIEYAHRFANEYDVVWWISASFRATARQQFADLAEPLGLADSSALPERVRAVREALRTGRPHRRWLLVLDSADDLEQVYDLLPEAGGHVAVTTVTQGWTASGGVAEVQVERFTRAESISYARRHVERLTEEEADQLADAVEDFPLLLAQTAAWLDANRMSAAEYIGLLRRADADEIGIQTLPDYPIGFQTSWALTLDSLEQDSPEATELLRLFAMFSPGSIPVRQLQRARPGDLPTLLAELAADPARWLGALRRLSESTAVRMDYVQPSDSVGYVDSVEMHRLYHRFLRRTLTPGERDELAAVACRVLVSADPRSPSEVANWPVYAELLPHLHPSGALESSEAAVRDLVLNCIEYLRLRDEESTGLTLCEQVLARWRIRLAPTHPSMLVLVHQHANMLRRCGRYREAEAVGRSVVEQLAEERPSDDLDLLRAEAGLGGSLMALGLFKEAHQLFEEVWRAYDVLDGPEAPRTQACLNNLGVALGLLGRYQEAADVHAQLLLLRRESFGSDHQSTLLSGLTYARSLRLLGRHQDATALQETNALLHRQTMGDHHPQTLAAQHNQALCLRRSGDVPAAADLLRSLVERSRNLQGVRHPMTLMVQADHASFLRSHGDPTESAELTDAVADGYRHLLGDDHPYTVGVLGNRGLLLWLAGDRPAGARLIEQALRGMTNAVGADHPWTLGCALNAAAVRRLSGRPDEAAELRRDTLLRARDAVGPDHPLVRACEDAPATGTEEPPGWDFEPQPI
ncbi:FxSxx-COOH system tetratricopeptide repeat protein [Streptomyces sp. NPDC101455]|uniref:FxSxx-COOH system tetratricopeptide repeat protein n=1 Tax=Streptomyces sp. NPDC101455 TaxID=3366142 RepID=UPI0038118AB8